jgi:hypothetical protein
VFVLWFYLTKKSQIIFLHSELDIKIIIRDLNLLLDKYEIVAHFFAFRLNCIIFIIIRIAALFLITDDELRVTADFCHSSLIARVMWLRVKRRLWSILA